MRVGYRGVWIKLDLAWFSLKHRIDNYFHARFDPKGVARRDLVKIVTTLTMTDRIFNESQLFQPWRSRSLKKPTILIMEDWTFDGNRLFQSWRINLWRKLPIRAVEGEICDDNLNYSHITHQLEQSQIKYETRVDCNL